MKNILKKFGLLFLSMVTLFLSVISGNNTEKVKAAGEVYTLVEDVNELAVGDKVIIVAADANVAMSTTQTSNNRDQTSITKEGKTVIATSDVQVITIEFGSVDGTFAFNVGGRYLYAASSSSNYLRTGNLDANASWEISIVNGISTIKAKGTYKRNWMRYNSSSSLFACYGSGQDDISLYKLSTTQPEAPKPKVASVEQLNTLLNNHYSEGKYIRNTEIFVNAEAVALDLMENYNGSSFESLFHNGAASLSRITYFNQDELWMTNLERTINSGYGTDEDGNLTHFTYKDGAKYNEKIAARKPLSEEATGNWHNWQEPGMEGFYITLKDILADESHNWEVLEGVYSSTSAEVIEWFKAFTAPCYLGFNEKIANYIIFDHVEIEEVEGALELRLYASETEAPKLSNSKCMFSRAVIQEYKDPENPGVILKEATIEFSSTENRIEFSTSKQVWVDNGITITNNKDASSSNVADYSNPMRCYKNSTLILEYQTNFSSISVVCEKAAKDANYAEDLASAIGETATVTVEGNIVLITLNESTNKFEVILTAGKVFINSITIYAA